MKKYNIKKLGLYIFGVLIVYMIVSTFIALYELPYLFFMIMTLGTLIVVMDMLALGFHIFKKPEGV